jgi:hypothetical protein
MKLAQMAPNDKEVARWKASWDRSDPECWLRLHEISEKHNVEELRQLSRDMKELFHHYADDYARLDES